MKKPLLEDTSEHLTEAAVGAGTTLAPPGTVFVVVRGMSLAHTFPVCRTSRPVAFNQDIKGLVFRDDIEPSFAHAWLDWAAPLCLQMVSNSSHGTKRLETDRLLSLEFPIFVPAEQQALVSRLEELDGVLARMRERIEGSTTLWRSILSSALVEAAP
jgi:type I restriction enzyme S subunit